MGMLFNAGRTAVLRTISISPLIAANPLTFSCWFFPLTLQTGGMVWLGKSSTGSNYISMSTTSAGKLRGNCRNIAILNADTANLYRLGEWNHAFMTVDASANVRTVLNGDFANAGTNTGTTITGTDRFSIGGDDDLTAGPYCDAALADVGAWDLVLRDADCLALRDGLSPRAVRWMALQYHYPLHRGAHDNHVGQLMSYINGGGAPFGSPPHMTKLKRRVYDAPAVGGGIAIPVLTRQYRQRWAA